MLIKNIIISSSNLESCLGHEIHVTRCVIIDMLLQKYINEDDIIVVKNDDRKFLYQLLFKTVLSYKEFSCLTDIEKYNTIDLYSFSANPDAINHQNFKGFTYSSNYYNKNFKECLLKIKYTDKLIIDSKFILIHHRYNFDISILKKMCDKIKNTYENIKIIIFNNSIDELKKKIDVENVLFIDNLQLYATYLHDTKCQLFISEWSGGGQLSQYCNNGKVKYYYYTYPPNYTSMFYNENYNKSMISRYDILWDFKKPSDCEIEFFKNTDELIPSI